MRRSFGVEVFVKRPREPGKAPPPALWLWLMRAAAWIAPANGRAEWNSRWSARLWNLWVLADRGEFAGRASTETARLCVDAVAAAFWMRFNRAALRRWLRGPRSILSAGGVALVLLAVLSHGFRATRELVLTIIDWKTDRLAPKLMRYDPRGDFVVAHLVPIAMALMVGVAISLLARRSLPRCGWRYRLFLWAKLLLLAVLVPLTWIEGGGFLRAHMWPGALRVALATAFTLVFFGFFGCCVIWVLADQRSRCPVCLGRLALPVTLGSWASVFDPATTEMICDEGHGSLTVAETEMTGEDRWIKLDASWREF